MFKKPRLCSPENVDRARYAQMVVLILAVVISVYLGMSTFSAVRRVWNARRLLNTARMESGNLSRQASVLECEEAKQPRHNEGGVDMFALQFSRWAAEQSVKVAAVTPQGDPVAGDISVDGASLGTWNAIRVRVEGKGDFSRVVKLMDRFRDPGMPVKLESFSFQSAAMGSNDAITFDLTLTVYERKTGAS